MMTPCHHLNIMTTDDATKITTTNNNTAKNNDNGHRPILMKARRRQSLRSYLQNVSLSDAIKDDITTKNTNNNNNSNSSSSCQYGSGPPKSGSNRRRRLEVMGLLKHLKINRYDDSSSSTTTIITNNHNNNNNLDTSDESHSNNDDNNNSGSIGKFLISGNTKHHHQQRCLLHPTVRMRNDKCSLCCALDKTLEVRNSYKVEEENEEVTESFTTTAAVAPVGIAKSTTVIEDVGADDNSLHGDLEVEEEEEEEMQKERIGEKRPEETIVNEYIHHSNDKILSTKGSDGISSSITADTKTRTENAAAVAATVSKNEELPPSSTSAA